MPDNTIKFEQEIRNNHNVNKIVNRLKEEIEVDYAGLDLDRIIAAVWNNACNIYAEMHQAQFNSKSKCIRSLNRNGEASIENIREDDTKKKIASVICQVLSVAFGGPTNGNGAIFSALGQSFTFATEASQKGNNSMGKHYSLYESNDRKELDEKTQRFMTTQSQITKSQETAERAQEQAQRTAMNLFNGG